MNIYQNYLNQVKASVILARNGIGRLYLRLKILHGNISAYIQVVINREMPSLHVKDLPNCKKVNIMKIHVWESKGLWYFHIKAGNGKIVAASEGYTKKCNALKTIHALKMGIAFAQVKE